MKKIKNLPLLAKIGIGLVLGITIGLLGLYTGQEHWDNNVAHAIFYNLTRGFATSSGIIGGFLSFMIPLIIVGFITAGIASFGNKSKKMLGWTIGLAYVSTLLAGLYAWGFSELIFPHLGLEGAEFERCTYPVICECAADPFFTLGIPPLMGPMTALILAFMMGIGIVATKAERTLGFFEEFQEIVTKVIKNVIIPLLPLHIAGIFAQMAFTGEVQEVLGTFGLLFVIVIAMQWLFILIQYLIASIVRKENCFPRIKNMMPAYLTAIGTQSSAATIPVKLKCMKTIGIKDEVAEFVTPLGASTHLSGSTIALLSCALAVVVMTPGLYLTTGGIIQFIILLGITMVAAPGVPGGAVVAALGLLEYNLGFGTDALALMVAVYIAQDAFGTATNVMGDGPIALIVDKVLDADEVQDDTPTVKKTTTKKATA